MQLLVAPEVELASCNPCFSCLLFGLVAETAGTHVCGVSDFERPRKKSFTVDGRNIFLVKKKENFYAIDNQCYHMGGPLYKGDIEDFNGRTCIRCPWHRYCVTIDTGESLYQRQPEESRTIDHLWNNPHILPCPVYAALHSFQGSSLSCPLTLLMNLNHQSGAVWAENRGHTQ